MVVALYMSVRIEMQVSEYDASDGNSRTLHECVDQYGNMGG